MVTAKEVIEYALETLKAEYVKTQHVARFHEINKVRAYHIHIFEISARSGQQISEEHRRLAIALLDEMKPGWNRMPL